MLKNPQGMRGFASRLSALALISTALVAGLAVAPAAAASNTVAVDSASTARTALFSQRPYVALGDSFTAGQGAPPYKDDTCKQSRSLGYPTIAAALSLYKLTENRACSGANVAATAAQLAGLNPNTQLVTLTVGGIDAGSNALLAACAANPDPTVDPCKSAILASQAALAALGPQLVGLYSTIASTLPNAKIAVLNYPLLFKPGIAPVGDLVNSGTTQLNAVIAGAVAATGNPKIQLVDVTDEFKGHGIGSLIPYIAFNPKNLLADQNFHPNALGNSLGYGIALAKDRVFAR
ncbi:SGNH/GDSL hydrolase family protein [Agromyces protaetiae]|uniref:SGNH/GDSL hydrolase family protein n=1 Tax=Agromyces protaetiae TaxID=2509455 RepID=A0A4P6FDZ1_9MICO|nr:SGNH/GDSL hydrolase family protein [Agromyces protaetiae]QAY74352.1 SGNH/GDSL hydrolase family protein [Agromyces protaetiae]